MKCPICEKKIQNINQGYIEQVLVEEQAYCKDEYHLYGYEFLTGMTRETIGDVTVTGCYSDSKEEMALQKKQIDEALKTEKEKYRNKIRGGRD